MATTRYYHLDITQPFMNSILRSLKALHQATWPNNTLSVTYNASMTEVVVKVENDTLSPVSSPALIKVYDKSEHSSIVSMFNKNKPEWDDDYKTAIQWSAIEAKQANDKVKI